MQGGSQCYCDNDYDSHGKAEEADCSVACPGDAQEKCGGSLVNSVYTTGHVAGGKVVC